MHFSLVQCTVSHVDTAAVTGASRQDDLSTSQHTQKQASGVLPTGLVLAFGFL